MKIEFSKEFGKAIKKLSGKKLNSVRTVIMEVRAAEKINQLTNCKSLLGIAMPTGLESETYGYLFQAKSGSSSNLVQWSC